MKNSKNIFKLKEIVWEEVEPETPQQDLEDYQYIDDFRKMSPGEISFVLMAYDVYYDAAIVWAQQTAPDSELRVIEDMFFKETMNTGFMYSRQAIEEMKKYSKSHEFKERMADERKKISELPNIRFIRSFSRIFSLQSIINEANKYNENIIKDVRFYMRTHEFFKRMALEKIEEDF